MEDGINSEWDWSKAFQQLYTQLIHPIPEEKKQQDTK